MSEPSRDASFERWAESRRERLEDFARATLTAHSEAVSDPALRRLWEVMSYALLDGGKRVRALLVYAGGELLGAAPAALDRVAFAFEAIHAYSLVHDDLPCMDDDLWRRGRPSCHARFGEAPAVLAGDALQPLAFSVLGALSVGAKARLALIRELARACGADGMCGGQMLDISVQGRDLGEGRLRLMHRLKTGALIEAAAVSGALLVRAAPPVTAACRAYGAALGLAFQVVDDILDRVGAAAELGKTPGKDAAAGKPTYVSLLGLDGARALAARCRGEAGRALEPLRALPGAAPALDRLERLADFFVARDR